MRGDALRGRKAGMGGLLVLALCAVLGAHLVVLPDVAAAGGRRHVSHGPHGRGQAPAHRHVPIQAEVPRKSAFGSPGGFPFPDEEARHGVARLITRRIAFPRHSVFTWFAPPVALYDPGIQYGVTEQPAPPVVNVSPVIYASPAVYVSPPVAQPAPALSAAPAESPLPRVVEHATGRYELRGDGTATPYEWVWIPYPPPAPPEDVTPPTRESSAAPARATERTRAYRWTDEDGTIFVTNRLDRIPEPHRSQARGPVQ